MYVLSEFESLGMESEGLRLWQALRRVRDWHGAPADDADVPPQSYADVDPALRPSLAALERLLRDPEPDDDTLEAVAFCCYNAAMWADERGAYWTAVGLLHAAEDIYPDNPHYAYNLGRVARKMAFYEESEAWLKWAHYVARSFEKWEVATLALSGLGNLHRQRGNLPKARRFHEVTRRMAKLRGLRTLEGDALYDLAIMSGDFGDHRLVVEYARKALYAYGPGHSQIYCLAHDIAWYWMDSLGDFKNASHVFSALLDHVWKPSQRLLICANLARAAAGAGWKDLFESMWLESWGVIRQSFDQEGHAAALTQLALGAGSLSDWERTSIAATEALKIGRARKEAPIVHFVESILTSVNGSLINDSALHVIFKDLSRQAEHTNDLATEFAPELANAMRARRDGAPESPTRALMQKFN
jgi:tetratricopeptide (TPR) repeat protein